MKNLKYLIYVPFIFLIISGIYKSIGLFHKNEVFELKYTVEYFDGSIQDTTYIVEAISQPEIKHLGTCLNITYKYWITGSIGCYYKVRGDRYIREIKNYR
jgi:hypothetical protein